MFKIDSRENIPLDLMEFICTVRNRTEEAPTIINTRKSLKTKSKSKTRSFKKLLAGMCRTRLSIQSQRNSGLVLFL
jgi:hypothetical protein